MRTLRALLVRGVRKEQHVLESEGKESPRDMVAKAPLRCDCSDRKHSVQRRNFRYSAEEISEQSVTGAACFLLTDYRRM